MELTIVGCSGSVSGPDSPASCYLVRAPYEGRTYALVLDLGPGSFGAAYRYLDPAHVDAIGLSHLHPDHCLDLTGFYVAAHLLADRALAADPGLRTGRDGSPGSRPRLRSPGAAPEQRRARRTVRLPDLAPGDRSARSRWTDRGRPSGGGVLAADHRAGRGVPGLHRRHRPQPGAGRLLGGADLLLAEAAFLDAPDNPPGIHLIRPRRRARSRPTAGVGRLVLTHIPAWIESARDLAEARPHFAGPILLAEPGLRITI